MENESTEKPDVKQEISELKELYSKELERQAEERSRQSESVEQEKKSQSEADKAKQEAVEKSKTESQERFNQVLEKLGSIDNKLTVDTGDAEQEALIKELQNVNGNLKSIITYQENSHQYELNNQSLMTMGVAVLIVGFGVFALYKFGGFIVSKIINMIN
ncbi:hypothetical protein IGI37_001662 [Enterococcus sp. AZ194]|uniref:hypothetical protein n=1 Tax=Enterococcus sp. AZ194 TaxID=2774629 RepID=UPI003F287F0B